MARSPKFETFIGRLKTLHLTRMARSSSGLTLIEIMIVVTIMAAIMGVAGYYLLGASDRANIKMAETEVGNMKGFVEIYYSNFNSFPDGLQDLIDPPDGGPKIMEEIPVDPWGNDYVYEKNSDGVTISSPGPDGNPGNDDDISTTLKR